jgi:hypothetical protein
LRVKSKTIALPGRQIVLSFCCCVLLMSCFDNEIIQLKPLHPYSIENTINLNDKDCKRRTAYFTVNASVSDSLKLKNLVDSLINNMPDSSIKNYCISSIEVFEETDKLNERFISTEKDHPIGFAKQLLFTITWNDGSLTAIKWFKDGLFIDKGEGIILLPNDNDN